MRTQLIAWLGSQQTVIENLICQSAKAFVDARYIERPNSNFLFDLRASEKEALALSRGGDLCYDRHTVGMSYALWYQGRRINTALTFCLDFVEEAIKNKKPLEVFDLGAGTGAVQIAIGLCLEGARILGYELPQTRIINVDISPFMMDYNRSFLWRCFRKQYEACRTIRAEYLVNSWTNPEELHLQTPYFVASYLFDHTENRTHVAEHFKAIIETHRPEKFILLTSNQYQKRVFLDAVVEAIVGIDYGSRKIDSEFVFSGTMKVIEGFRRDFNAAFGPTFSVRAPGWSERSFYAKLLTLNQTQLSLQYRTEGEPTSLNQLNLYIPPIKVRKSIRLSPPQEKAARLTNRPTVITGPAGCGKSVVITERLKRLCESMNYDPSLKILITTFNKDLIAYLGDWLENILDSGIVKKRGCYFYFNNSKSPNISLLHFDVLPTRIGNHGGILEFENAQKYYIQKTIDEIRIIEKLGVGEFNDVLNPHFLYDEYVRVIYGQQYDSIEKYLYGTRRRRPFQLKHDGDKRKLIWKTIITYLRFIERKGKASIYSRRHKFLRDLRGGEYQNTFTHIFVDEFQDCTQADYQIFYGLLSNNNQLVIAGDYAQAVHLGKSAEIPREEQIFQGAVRMRNFDKIPLEGSFRLPFRISECIKPLCQYLKSDDQDEIDVISPYKGSPPGARPIVVYSNGVEDMTMKLHHIYWHFEIYDLFNADLPDRKKITILEKDQELCQYLNRQDKQMADTSTILKLKGMEKDCIVWSTRSKIEDIDDVFYYIYTILTRTCSVLIIALFDDVPAYVYQALSKMDKNRLMLWDQESKEIFEREIKRFESTQEVLDLQVDE